MGRPWGAEKISCFGLGQRGRRLSLRKAGNAGPGAPSPHTAGRNPFPRSLFLDTAVNLRVHFLVKQTSISNGLAGRRPGAASEEHLGRVACWLLQTHPPSAESVRQGSWRGPLGVCPLAGGEGWTCTVARAPTLPEVCPRQLQHCNNGNDDKS